MVIDGTDEEFQSVRLNWGAFVFTPVWLLRNGFLVTLAVYLVAGAFFWPVSVLISVVFLFNGTKWSWGNGSRWETTDKFLDSQHSWNFVAKLILAVSITLGLLYALKFIAGI